MAQVCRLRGVDGTHTVKYGTVSLTDGQVSAEFTPGNQNIVNEVVFRPNVVGDTAIHLAQDPAGWFAALPTMYHGTYFWAEMDNTNQATK